MKIKMNGKKLKDILKSSDADIIKNRLKERYPQNFGSKNEKLDAMFGKGKWKELDVDNSGSIEADDLPSIDELKEKYTVKELKSLLSDKGLSTRGKEETLAKRLLSALGL